MRANVIEVADGLHGRGGEHFADGGQQHDGRDHGGGCPGSGLGGGRGQHHRACSSNSTAGAGFAGRSVSDGPWATKPTPTVMSTMPAQRSSEMGSCSQNFDNSATMTLPKRGGRQYEREIGPGERGEIAGEEADQQGDAGGDPRRKDGCDERCRMSQSDRRQLRHAARQAGVSERCADGDESQDQVLPRRECVVRHSSLIEIGDLPLEPTEEGRLRVGHRSVSCTR